MNKTAIKNFAVWARNKLIADITYKAGLIGVSEKGIALPLPQSSKDLQFFDIGTKDYTQVAGADIEQRNALVRAIQEKERTSDYKTAFKAVIEEVAYTWFNRLIAIRFMEVNEYLSSKIRVLSSENPAKNEPDLVTTPFDTDMEFTMAEQDKIMQLKDENKLDELFRMLFIKQCNKLHEILPELFEETNNYTELLLSISFTDNDGIVYHLVHDIPEGDFNVEKEGQVEIIGWMYQYYNIEPKDETFALLKKNVKITKERIPAATQLFTPDWIVRYMVENSLGRLWVEGHPSDSLKENWKYYLEEAEQEASVQAQLEQIRAEYRNLKPEDIKVIDPCMGSGHILVYCFDVLMQIYESQGYTQRDAAQSILENNLFGLDIDKRAAQLTYFAVMMKARQYDRRIFTREIKPHVYAIEESNGINRGQLKYFGAELSPTERNNAALQITGLLDTMVDAKEYGSILNIENYDWELILRFVESIDDAGQMSLDIIGIEQTQAQLLAVIKIARVLAQKYEVVVTNPPYMDLTNANSKLKKKQNECYPNCGDLYVVFIERCKEFCKAVGFCSMITMQGWMFSSSFLMTRSSILKNHDLISLLHLGSQAFSNDVGTIVQNASFVLRGMKVCNYKGCFVNLTGGKNTEQKERMFFCEKLYSRSSESFYAIEGFPLSYWATDKIIDAFTKYPPISEYLSLKAGLSTGNNDLFCRYWYEVNFFRIKFDCKTNEESINTKGKWFPCNSGGEYRKWITCNKIVVNWENNGNEIRHYRNSRGNIGSAPRNSEFYFKKGMTWNKISSKFTMMYKEQGFIFDDTSRAGFVSNENYLFYCIAFLSSMVANKMLLAMNQTFCFTNNDILRLPFKMDENISTITLIVKQNVSISKEDWDSFETSWDFQRHPIVKAHYNNVKYQERGVLSSRRRGLVQDCYIQWRTDANLRFETLRHNEEKLNRIFIDIYGLQEELAPEVEDKDVTVRKADLGRDIRSLLSYAVGCMFGRYSLDEPGLIYAGGDWDSSKYSTFIPDKDNCIPITDEEYFEDDIVGLFVVWLKEVYGEDSLEENLDFIAKALGNKGITSREVIRNYFLNDFIKDHIKIYQKRPIYWLFDSGRKNGFKALVYMHRWNADTVGNLRVEYLHKMQHIYEREIVRMQETIDNSRDSREVSKATKRKDKLQKQLKETKDYDAKLAHIALSRIEIDLDDGVKVNYEKVQTGRDGKKMQILAKI